MLERQTNVCLSATEHQAIEIGIRDADCGCLISTEGNGLRAKLAKLSRVITGQRGRRPLADPKLEAVREFACRTHMQRRPAEQLVPALMKHGYGPNEIGTLTALSA